MWRCVCHWVNTPELFTFERNLCLQLQVRYVLTHVEQTVCRQQCTCANCLASLASELQAVDGVWNVMAHPQKTDFVFATKRTSLFKSGGGRQFSRMLAAEVCSSGLVILETPCSEVVWSVLATHCIQQFPPSTPVRRVPSHFNWSLQLPFRWILCILWTV